MPKLTVGEEQSGKTEQTRQHDDAREILKRLQRT